MLEQSSKQTRDKSMNFFKDCQTVEQVKHLYRQLARENHPDLGGDTAKMQEINSQYEQALRSCNGQISTDEEGKKHTYNYNDDIEKDIMRVISELLSLKIDGDVYLIGVWVWIVGNTKPHKEQLKNLNCRWHAKRAAWYYRAEIFRGYGANKGNLSDIASKYGCQSFKKEDEKSENKKNDRSPKRIKKSA